MWRLWHGYSQLITNLINSSMMNGMKYCKSGLRQHTFVFEPADMENGNKALDEFCEKHNVLSIIFSESKGKLVYVMLYKKEGE